MRGYYLAGFFGVAAILWLVACSGGNQSGDGPISPSQEPGDATISTRTKVLDAAALEALDAASVTAADGVLIFDGHHPEVTAGDAIVSDVSEKTPHGLLRLVTTRRQEAERLFVQTESAALTDIVEAGTLASSGSVAEWLPSRGQRTAAAQQARLHILDRCPAEGLSGTIDTEGGEGTSDDFRAELTLDLNYHLALTIVDSAVQHFELRLEPQREWALAVTRNGAAELPLDTVLFSCPLGPIRLAFGHVPVVITPLVHAVLRPDLLAEDGFELQLSTSSNLSVGIVYQEGVWTPIHSGSFAAGSPRLEEVAQGTIAPSVTTTFAFYQTLAASVGVTESLELRFEDDDLVLYGDAAVDLALDAEVLGFSSPYQESLPIPGARRVLASSSPAPAVVDLTLDTNSANVLETAAAGTSLAQASTTTSFGTVVDYSLEPLEAPFAIDGETGVITVSGALDHEAQPGYVLTVVATATFPDAKVIRAETNLTVNVDDVILTLGFDAGEAIEVSEAASEGTLLATAHVTGSSLSPRFALDPVTAPFAIDAQSGEIRVRAALDYDLQPSHSLIITALVAGESGSATLRVTVTRYEDGSARYPYRIDSLAELQSLATGFQNETLVAPLALADSLEASYLLVAPIDAASTAEVTYDSGADGEDDSGRGFLPIGGCGVDGDCFGLDAETDNQPFEGRFDGGGYAISGLVIQREDAEGVGLFGYLGSEAEVLAVALQDVQVRGSRYVGGLVGLNGGEARDVLSSGAVDGGYYVGGLVGLNRGAVRGGFARGLVRGSSYVGGLVGDNNGGEMLDSLATTESIGDGDWVGGLVGRNKMGTVRASLAAGGVHGGSNVGGLIGENDQGTVQDALASGSVSGTGSAVGGLIGENDHGAVQDALASGNVRGGANVGGLIGDNSGGTVQDVLTLSSVDVLPDGAGTGIGGLVGRRYQGIVQRVHYVDSVIVDEEDKDDTRVDGIGVGDSSDMSSDGWLLDQAALRAITCGSTLFRWDDPSDDPDAGELTCEAVGAAFPWDFGTGDELPVLKDPLGGGLDAAAQRAQIAFATVERNLEGALGTAISYALPASGSEALPPQIGTERSFFWGVPQTYTAVTGLDSPTIAFIADVAGVLTVTVIERDAEGNRVRLYADRIALNPAE